jgi:hypothetical protein
MFPLDLSRHLQAEISWTAKARIKTTSEHGIHTSQVVNAFASKLCLIILVSSVVWPIIVLPLRLKWNLFSLTIFCPHL